MGEKSGEQVAGQVWMAALRAAGVGEFFGEPGPRVDLDEQRRELHVREAGRGGLLQCGGVGG